MSVISSLITNVSALATAMGNALQLRGFKEGGTAGQVPVKTDGTDFNWEWQNIPTSATFDDGSFANFASGSQANFASGSEASFASGSLASFASGSQAGFLSGSLANFYGGSLASFASGSEASFASGSLASFASGSEASFGSGSFASFGSGSFASFGSGSQANFGSGSQANFDGSVANFDSGSQASFTSGSFANFASGSFANFTSGSQAFFDSGSRASFNGSLAEFYSGSEAVFASGSQAGFGSGSFASFGSGSVANFDDGSQAVFASGSGAVFASGSQANFDGSVANFASGSQASFTSGSQAFFDSGSEAFFASGSLANFASGTIKLVGTHTSSLNFVDPTSAKTITLPDATGTVALTNDARFTDARTPLAHTHVVSDIVSIASQRLIGRHAGGTGAGQEIQASGGVEFSDDAIQRSALTGDITASAGSNATTLATTIAGNKTFSGTMALSSTLTVGGQTQLAATQAATDENSAMTRGLAGIEPFLTLGRIYRPSTPSFSTSSTGSASAQLNAGESFIDIRSGSANSGFARAIFARGINSYPGITNVGVRFGQRIGVSLHAYFLTNVTANTNVIRVTLGAPSGTPPAFGVNPISALGFGFEIQGNGGVNVEIRAFAFGAGGFVASAFTALGALSDGGMAINIISDGAGNIALAVSTAPSRDYNINISLTGAPTTTGVSANSFIAIDAINASTSTTQCRVSCRDVMIITN